MYTYFEKDFENFCNYVMINAEIQFELESWP